jgi:hypothetical protein
MILMRWKIKLTFYAMQKTHWVAEFVQQAKDVAAHSIRLVINGIFANILEQLHKLQDSFGTAVEVSQTLKIK